MQNLSVQKKQGKRAFPQLNNTICTILYSSNQWR